MYRVEMGTDFLFLVAMLAKCSKIVHLGHVFASNSRKQPLHALSSGILIDQLKMWWEKKINS